jgi:hypothetical protein
VLQDDCLLLHDLVGPEPVSWESFTATELDAITHVYMAPLLFRRQQHLKAQARFGVWTLITVVLLVCWLNDLIKARADLHVLKPAKTSAPHPEAHHHIHPPQQYTTPLIMACIIKTDLGTCQQSYYYYY